MDPFARTPDEELMAEVKRGRPDAFAELYHRHKSPLLRFCYQMLRNWEDAADIFQDAFRYLLTHASTYEPTAKFTTYLYRIARNQCIDVLRRRRRWNLQALEALPEPPDDSPTRGSRLESDEVETRLAEAMEEVPEPYREVVVLRLVQGLEYADIAGVIDVPVGTVKSRLHVGLERLRRVLRQRKIVE